MTRDATARCRRSILKAGGALALTAAAGLRGGRARAADAVPFSAGTEAPSIRMPPDACDCHIHILSTRFPASSHGKGQPVLDSDVAAYRRLQARLGTGRVVVVTPSTYGTDSRKASGRQNRSASAWILVVRPPRERPMA